MNSVSKMSQVPKAIKLVAEVIFSEIARKKNADDIQSKEYLR